MNILLSRILTYLNGTLFYDSYYKICTFVIFSYNDLVDIESKMTEEKFLKDINTFFLKKDGEKFVEITKQNLQDFVNHFGFPDYDAFHTQLVTHHETRCNQIRVRMIGVSSDDLIAKMDKACSDEEMRNEVSEICAKMYKANRIVVIGALYPISIAVELQTDMITFGKPFIQLHTYDPIVLNEKDVVIFISATGRALEGFRKNRESVHIDDAHTVLITQNKKYLRTEANNNTHVLYVPGKFDSINFNYQIMTIFDLLRIHYYQQYYL